MSTWNKIMECVPNFSEGRDLAKIEKIVDKFRAKAGVKLLDYSNDEDHNRLVVTVVGEPEALKDALLEAIGQAVELIDLTKHSGRILGWERSMSFLLSRSEGVRWMRRLRSPKKWARRWLLSIECRSSCMRSRLRLHTEKTWRRSAKESLRVWKQRSSSRNGNLTSGLPNGIRRQGQWRSAPVAAGGL